MSQETKYYAISKERLLYIESCERALAAADALAEAAEKLNAIKIAAERECIHGEESWYCEGCQVAWESEMANARVELEAKVEAYRKQRQ